MLGLNVAVYLILPMHNKTDTWLGFVSLFSIYEYIPSLFGNRVIVTSRTAEQTPYFGNSFTLDRRKTKWPYNYSPVILCVIHLHFKNPLS